VLNITASRTNFARRYRMRSCASMCPRVSSFAAWAWPARIRVRSTMRPSRFVIVSMSDPRPVIKITGVIAS